MRYIAMALIALLASVKGICQNLNTPKMEAAILAEANKMADLLMKKDYARYVEYAHPGVFKLLKTDKKGFEAQIKKQMDDLAIRNVAVKYIKFGKPMRIIDTAKTLQCIVPETLCLKSPKSEVINHNALLAVSTDGGKKWYFTEVTPENFYQLRAAIPTISKKHIIPKHKVDYGK